MRQIDLPNNLNLEELKKSISKRLPEGFKLKKVAGNNIIHYQDGKGISVVAVYRPKKNIIKIEARPSSIIWFGFGVLGIITWKKLKESQIKKAEEDACSLIKKSL
jgi:hypothetical protein